MQLDLNNLPSDPALLHRLVRDIASLIEHRNGEIERLRLIIKQLQRAQYGRRSERLDSDQFALGLEDLDTDLAVAETDPAPIRLPTPAPDAPLQRKSLPAHLPRDEVVLVTAGEACEGCGGALHYIGESVSEMLDCARRKAVISKENQLASSAISVGTLIPSDGMVALSRDCSSRLSSVDQSTPEAQVAIAAIQLRQERRRRLDMLLVLAGLLYRVFPGRQHRTLPRI
jgi:hypothetical protein